MSDDEAQVDLFGVVEVLHEHLTAALCESVWDRVRTKERRRELLLSTLAEFWLAVVLRAPPSLSQALAEAQRVGPGAGPAAYPPIATSSQAFFARCQGLRAEFFAHLFEAFREELEAAEPPCFAREQHALAERLGGPIWILDGSSLDKVARRLKVLWNDRRVPLPGLILAFYDLCAGRLARFHHTRELQPQEGPQARELLAQVPAGTLLVVDALYGTPVFLQAAAAHKLRVLARRHGKVKYREERRLSRHTVDGARIEDWVVTYGIGRGTDGQQVRLVRSTHKGKTFELVTNILDPGLLGATEALRLYRERWRVERLFYELKEVLNLHRFYAGNLNAVAMQLYIAAIVHLALRAAQARIARAVKLEPEALSTEKLFPKLAAASTGLVTAEQSFDAVLEINPGVRIQKPDWHVMPFASARLKDVVVQPRGPGGRKKRLKPDGRRLRTLPEPKRKRRR